MSKNKKKGANGKRRAVSAVLFALTAVLIVVSVAGYAIRGRDATAVNLDNMRTSAVLHAASGGLIDSIAQEANAAKLKELRSRSDFRTMGMDEVKALCAEAESAAREEAEALYGNTDGADTVALEATIASLEKVLNVYSEKEAAEMEVYADLYTDMYNAVSDWTDFVAGFEEDDDGLFAKMTADVPALGEESNAHFKTKMLKMVRKLADEEQEADDAETLEQLNSGVAALVTDWADYSGMDDESLWLALTELMPNLADAEAFRADVLENVQSKIEAAENGELTETAAEEEADDAAEETEFAVDYSYFVASDALNAQEEQIDEAFGELWAVLVDVIPDLDELSNKMQKNVRTSIETIVNSGSMDFSERYDIYAAEGADAIFEGSNAIKMKLAAYANRLLLAGLAVLLFAFVYTFWERIIRRFGVPRTIITIFFIYLCFGIVLYDMSLTLMLGHVLTRVGMYGILALAMLPGIQCGIGLNMGMTLGCIAGLLSTVIALQYNMTGYTALIFSCVGGALIAIPLGWGYGLLLNRMKGDEMTISTYVGYSFVSLMCIGWMLLPFTNSKIVWLLSGRGLRVTHSLLGSFAHLLDELWAFEIFGIEVPTGVLLFFGLCCLMMWLFSRSKVGIAMSAAGSNPRFAEASGINVDRMRTLGTVLSTVIAAVGIVIYSQAFGYAQLYTAPRQLGFIAASAILIGGATTKKAKVSHVIFGVFLFEGVLAMGQQIANAAVAGGGLSEVMRIMISNGIILYALTQSGGASRE